MDGRFKGIRPEESILRTLEVALEMFSSAERMVTIGGRCLDWEPGYEKEFDVFEMRKDNIRQAMRLVRYGLERQKEEEQDDKNRKVQGLRGGDLSHPGEERALDVAGC